jgi:hypothetical protein
VVQNARYLTPADPGASTEMLPESLIKFSFPDGAAWL